jgi:hypothetical protein
MDTISDEAGLVIHKSIKRGIKEKEVDIATESYPGERAGPMYAVGLPLVLQEQLDTHPITHD